ncbi:MAG TPA: amino acid deaminase [Terracidiphilus sp.]|nr:amino acid deaminase [Terracidiphilus sp.]
MSQSEIAHTTILSAISPLNKGIGLLSDALEPEEIVARGWSLLKEDLGLPCAVLYEDKLRHNLEWMKQFISSYGVQLAPHGKTTMAPKLFKMQLESGAWGITLATAHQTMVAWKHGVRRVLMANQLIGKQNMSIIANLLEDPDFEYYCLVDSVEQVDQLGAFFAGRGHRLNVLLELGVVGGRTGARDEDQVQAVVRALGRWHHALAFCGVEMYEGVLDEEKAIRAFLQRTVDTTLKLISEGRFERAPVLLSGAGSAWYDVVAEEFSAAHFGGAVEIVLRPGCYLTHDVGSYKKAQARILASNPIAQKMQSGLEPALHIWAYVQSIPEPNKAIVTMGKRDAAFDSGLPTPALHYRPGDAAPKPVPAHWTLTKMMDQHAYMQIERRDDLRVGDMIGFDISHPCLTFDKWRALPVVNREFQVVDLVQTFF